MSFARRLFDRLQGQFARLSIFQRIALGTTFIILIGAVTGTLVTRHLVRQAADWWLIVLFALAGILLSLGINFWILDAALRPLRDLRRSVKRLGAGDHKFDPTAITHPDPDTIQLAAALNLLVTELEKSNQRLRALSERAITAQEDERMSIARSLHDDTGQALSMLIINLDRLADQISDSETKLKKHLSDTRDLAANALTELRRIVFGLRPAILDDLGLTAAIRWYARSNLEEVGIRVIVKAPGKPLEASPAVTTTLFRITQEAVNNIVRHAHAKTATFMLRKEHDTITLRVEDDGRGFDLAQTSEHALRFPQLGLLGIHERAELLGGAMTIESTPGKGTRLYVTIPEIPSGTIPEIPSGTIPCPPLE